jgi:hypothetical protein
VSAPQPTGGPASNGQWQPTTARWANRSRKVRNPHPHPGDLASEVRWSKVLAHTGSYEQFAYGTDTPSDWQGPLQTCLIGSPQSGTIFVDVDDENAYLGTRTGQIVGRPHAASTRGGGFHIVIDARGVPGADWPRQGPIAGGDIKSRGFIPLPGSEHYSGERYEPVRPSGPVLATRELIAAINADLADHRGKGGRDGNGGGGGSGGGHDGEVAAAVMSMVLRGLDREQCYEQWLTIAVPRDPSWPFTADDFERHYSGAVRKAGQVRAEDAEAARAFAGQAPALVTGPPPGQAARQRPGSPDSSARAGRARAELDEHNRSWLHDPDVNQLDFALCVAVAAGSAEDGEKLWGIIVGGSSSAKSEDIRMVFGTADARLGDLTAAGLISWMGAGKNMKTTGLLTRLPSPAFVVIEDLAPLLADTADKRNRSKLVALLRKVYDGEVQRDLGGVPGPAAWSGKVTVLAASTKVIDQQSALLDEGGPRWLLYRGKEAGAITRLAGAGRRIDPGARAAARARSAELAAEVAGHGRAAFGGAELSEQAAKFIGEIAVATGSMRGSVPRSGYGKREIEGIAATEEPWRLEAQLQILARAAMATGRTPGQAVLLARAVALGTVPPARMRAMEVLMDGAQHNATAIGREKAMHRDVARRALEDLQQLGITRCANEREDDEPGAFGVPWLWEFAVTDIARACRYVIGEG